MNKIWGKVKIACTAYVVLMTIISSSLAGIVYAIGGDTTIINPDPVTVDGVTLYKTAKTVDGAANAWDITMRIEAPEYKTTSDTVLVIDTSWSMNDNGRIGAAKDAAKTLAGQLLPEGNTTNRIAIVSFNDNVRVSNFGGGRAFAGVYSAVENRINNLAAQYNGGTFTQAGIREAAKLLETSTADIKSIILLSDGAPTYNYAITNPNDYLVDGGPGEILEADGYEKQTSTEVPESAFDYEASRKGQGSRMWSRYESVTVGTGIGVLGYPYNIKEVRYYNSGNCAIAEAGFYKNKDIGDLYTISLDSEELGDEILGQIASPGKAYTSDVSSLNTIFSQIAGSIKIQIQSASVTDIMRSGITVANDSDYGEHGAGVLNWAPDLEYDANLHKYVAEITYRVEVNDDIINNVDENGYTSISASSVLTYNEGKTMNFPTLVVKPVIVNIAKEVIGRTCDGCKFNVELTYPNEDKRMVVIKSGESISIVERWMEGKYTVVETGNANINSINFENYLVEYSQRDFIIDMNYGGDININIENIYETKDVIVKKYWDDDNDKDGLRVGYDLFLAVKDGDKYVGYQRLTGEDTYEMAVIVDLPKYRNGKEIEYSVEESTRCATEKTISFCSKFEGDDNYTVRIDGNTIINQHITETVDLQEKDWDSEDGVLTNVSLVSELGEGAAIKAPETGKVNKKIIDGAVSVNTVVVAMVVFSTIGILGAVVWAKRKF